jgi:hypothetical protein
MVDYAFHPPADPSDAGTQRSHFGLVSIVTPAAAKMQVHRDHLALACF